MRVSHFHVWITILVLLQTSCDRSIFSSRDLSAVIAEQEKCRKELGMLGDPLVSQTVPQFGFASNFTVPGEPKKENAPDTQWVQIDLGQVQAIDQIALLPVLMDWHLLSHPAYRFPKRFRVDVSEVENFASLITICDHMQEDYPNPGVTPFVLTEIKVKARYVRITSGRDFFALAEVMVLQGKRNIAIGCELKGSDPFFEDERWAMKHLVDGRSPMGSPILFESLFHDGVFFGPTPDGTEPFVAFDLGNKKSLQELRLYPLHSNVGADIPGYKFPVKFRIELADTMEFLNPTRLFETASPFPNPGSNTVTIPFRDLPVGRFVRIVFSPVGKEDYHKRFALSEIQIYSEGNNIASSAVIASTPDPYPRRKDWPKNLLMDGYTSYGKILELPEQLENWVKRDALEAKLAGLMQFQLQLSATASKRQLVLNSVMGTLFVVGLGIIFIQMRQRKERQLEAFRKQLTQDLHDDVGSSLAAIGMYSEAAGNGVVPVGSEAWKRIHRISRETTDAMRETLWLAGGKAERNIDLVKHLRLASIRMLPGLEVKWLEELPEFPSSVSQEHRREIFLFFKEALANIARHAKAKSVSLVARFEKDEFKLEITDDGKGFLQELAQKGIGLASMRDRANRLKAQLSINSAPGAGTKIHLVMKLK